MVFPRASMKHEGTPRGTTLRRARLHAGFSLVELVVVLLIAAIMTAIAVPRFSNAAARARVTAAADRLGAQILLARDQARASSSPRLLSFVRGSGTVTVHDPDENVLETLELGGEPYLASVARTDLPSSRAEFTAYALPRQAGRVMLRSSGYLAIVSIGSDGTVSVSAVTPARSADPALADVVTDLGASLRVREIAATPGNVIAAATEEKE